MTRSLVVGILLVGVAGAITAQEPVRLRTVDVPRIGRDAPPVELPYFTQAGPGPESQPFRLRAELGRVVVLLFQAGDAFLIEFASKVDSLGSNVTVVVVSQDPGPRLVERASALALPYKFVSDTAGTVSRRYGVDVGARRAHGATAWVVSSLGKLSAREPGLLAGDSGAIDRLLRAVREAR